MCFLYPCYFIHLQLGCESLLGRDDRMQLFQPHPHHNMPVPGPEGMDAPQRLSLLRLLLVFPSLCHSFSFLWFLQAC